LAIAEFSLRDEEAQAKETAALLGVTIPVIQEFGLTNLGESLSVELPEDESFSGSTFGVITTSPSAWMFNTSLSDEFGNIISAASGLGTNRRQTEPTVPRIHLRPGDEPIDFEGLQRRIKDDYILLCAAAPRQPVRPPYGRRGTLPTGPRPRNGPNTSPYRPSDPFNFWGDLNRGFPVEGITIGEWQSAFARKEDFRRWDEHVRQQREARAAYRRELRQRRTEAQREIAELRTRLIKQGVKPEAIDRMRSDIDNFFIANRHSRETWPSRESIIRRGWSREELERWFERVVRGPTRDDARRPFSEEEYLLRDIFLRHALRTWNQVGGQLRPRVQENREGHEQAVRSFRAWLKKHGLETVGGEIEVWIPGYGRRRYDDGIIDPVTGGIIGVEIKSTAAAMTRWDQNAVHQYLCDRYVNVYGTTVVGRRATDREVMSVVKIQWTWRDE
jgi:hypothetical protein